MACRITETGEFAKSDQIRIAIKNFGMTHLSSNGSFADESCSNLISERSLIGKNSSILGDETNPFLKDMATNISLNFFHTEHENLPEIDKSLFEVEEPELIDIFEKSPLLKNPLTKPRVTNPFNDEFVSNQCKMFKCINPFEEVLKDDANLSTDVPEGTRNRKLDESEWQELDNLFQKALSSKLRLK